MDHILEMSVAPTKRTYQRLVETLDDPKAICDTKWFDRGSSKLIDGEITFQKYKWPPPDMERGCESFLQDAEDAIVANILKQVHPFPHPFPSKNMHPCHALPPSPLSLSSTTQSPLPLSLGPPLRHLYAQHSQKSTPCPCPWPNLDSIFRNVQGDMSDEELVHKVCYERTTACEASGGVSEVEEIPGEEDIEAEMASARKGGKAGGQGGSGAGAGGGKAGGGKAGQESKESKEKRKESEARDSLRVDRKHPNKKLSPSELATLNRRLMHAAAVKEDTEQVKRALEDGAEIDAINKDTGGRTALMGACLSGNAGAVRCDAQPRSPPSVDAPPRPPSDAPRRSSSLC
jgi:hypothetical protein